MTIRTKNADQPKVKQFNDTERDLRRVKDERVVAVRTGDHAMIVYCDKTIAGLRSKQVTEWQAWDAE